MKAFKLLAGVAAAASAAVILTSAVSAYDFGDKNLGKNWSLNATVGASEFADLTADSYVTVTFEADQEEEEYWSLKPMDSSWTFIDPNGEGGPELAEGKDAYPVEKDWTSITFKIPADFIDSVKEGGMVFIGHSLTLKTLTVSDEAPVTEAPAAAEAPADNNDAVGSTNAPSADKTNADTGVEGVATIAAVSLIAGAVMVISRKRK
ncbi:MAG: NPXTG-anchored protein [Ruminococcaceae bacterium]|nr:NPXTG-anchored protein [Oscillospiraceae bacterium]